MLLIKVLSIFKDNQINIVNSQFKIFEKVPSSASVINHTFVSSTNTNYRAKEDQNQNKLNSNNFTGDKKL